MADKKSDAVSHFFGGADDTVSDNPFSLNLDRDEESTPDELEGEIAVDMYLTDSAVVIVSPIAGVDPEEIEISATDDTLTISGERKAAYEQEGEQMHTQEIYWGAFSRTVTLPVPCEVDQASAAYDHGVLTVTVPKSAKAKKRTIKVKTSNET